MENETLQKIFSLNKIIHEPARLAILTTLAAVESVDFMFLKNATGLTKGNLSSHLSKLEAAQIIQIKKKFIGKTPSTIISMTATGQKSIKEYWDKLNELTNQIKGLK